MSEQVFTFPTYDLAQSILGQHNRYLHMMLEVISVDVVARGDTVVIKGDEKQVEECGVHFLENGSVLLKEDDCRIRISALELPLATYTKFKKYRVTEQDVTACIEKEAADYEILLAHNPVYFDAYKKWGADLVLSGHLHGGIIRLPGIGGLITPQAIPFPKYSGEMTTEGEQTIIVSRGLGTHTINLRFLNEAEMIVIHLRGEKDS